MSVPFRSNHMHPVRTEVPYKRKNVGNDHAPSVPSFLITFDRVTLPISKPKIFPKGPTMKAKREDGKEIKGGSSKNFKEKVFRNTLSSHLRSLVLLSSRGRMRWKRRVRV